VEQLPCEGMQVHVVGCSIGVGKIHLQNYLWGGSSINKVYSLPMQGTLLWRNMVILLNAFL